MVFNTKDMIKSELPGDSVTTLSPPDQTPELSNVEKLNSKNLVNEDNTPLPEKIKNEKIAEGVDQNTPDIVDCITQKVKDLIGVFTVPYGVATLDQFNTSSTGSIGQAFTDSFTSIKESFTNTVDGIKNMFNSKKQNNIDQVETGGLSLKKFLGCEEANVQFTPRERVQAQKQPAIITNKIESGTKESQVALTKQANDNVKQRTEPPVEKSKQEEVPYITDVEKVPPNTWDYYSIRIYPSPIAESVSPEVQQTLKNAGLSIISTSDKSPDQLLLFAVKKILETSTKYLYDIVLFKEQNPKISLYDRDEYDKQQKAIKDLPAGYLIVEFIGKNISYDLDNINYLYSSTTEFSINAKFKRPGEELSVVYKDSTQSIKITTKFSYLRADRKAISYYIVGETKPFASKSPYFVNRLENSRTKSTLKY